MNSSKEDIESPQRPTEEQALAAAAETVHPWQRRKGVCCLAAIALVALLVASAVAIAVTRMSSNKAVSAQENKEEDSIVGSWKQIGADLEGETTDDWFGSAVALSADGQTLAVGAM